MLRRHFLVGILTATGAFVYEATDPGRATWDGLPIILGLHVMAMYVTCVLAQCVVLFVASRPEASPLDERVSLARRIAVEVLDGYLVLVLFVFGTAIGARAVGIPISPERLPMVVGLLGCSAAYGIRFVRSHTYSRIRLAVGYVMLIAACVRLALSGDSPV